MTINELREKMYQLKIEIARIECDHHSNPEDLKDRLQSLKEEYGLVKKEIMKLIAEERREKGHGKF